MDSSLKILKFYTKSEVPSNSERIMPVALVIIKLRLSESISQLVSYSVSRINFKKKILGKFFN